MLFERRFFPFFVTQCLGAFNDNLFKNTLVLLLTFQASVYTSLSPGLLANLAAGLFILPFVLFSAGAGHLADRMDKARLMQWIKLAEVFIMALAGVGFYMHSVPMLMGALFLMGTHSAFFGPVKYSVLPQVLKDEELVAGNAWVEMGTFVAILLGTLAAGTLLTHTQEESHIATALLMVAIAGFNISRLIPPVPPVGTTKGQASEWSPRATWALIQHARRIPAVWRSILAISWFWLVGSVLLAQLPALVKDVLKADAGAVTGLLAVFSISVGIGSLLCERLSRKHVEIGLVPVGSVGISVFAADLWYTADHLPAAFSLAGLGLSALFSEPVYLRLAIDIGLLGVFGGIFIVPLYSLVQLRTPRAETSRAIAANNVVNAFFMVLGAGAAAGCLAAGITVPQIIGLLAVANAVVALYIYTVVPEFTWRFIIWVLVHTVYRVEEEGTDLIPSQGKALLICNHISFADAVIIAASTPRPIRFVMDHSIFKNRILGWFFRTAKAIPIAPQAVDAHTYERAFEEVRSALAQDEPVCIFPEGKITHSGEMNPFKPGILRILEETPDVPVVPMALSGLWGSTFSRKEKNLLRRFSLKEWLRTVRLHVGAPIEGTARYDLEHLHRVVKDLRGNWK